MVARACLSCVVALLVLGYWTSSFGITPQAERAAGQSEIRVVGPADRLVMPEPVPSVFGVGRAKTVGWPSGRAPNAPSGFRVTPFAEGLQNPRWLHVLPNGDVLVAECDRRDERAAGPSADRITLLRDADRDGRAEVREVLVAGLNQPIGLAFLGQRLYVANTDGLVAFPYQPGQTKITVPGEKILDIPGGGIHWTRTLRAKPDGSKLYIAVGSTTDFGAEEMEHLPPTRAAIWEVNPDGSGMRLYATGLRNAVGMDWAPGTNTLWTVVNERGGLGDDLPPDYLTSVREGGFYGWPYYYWGKHEENRLKQKRPDLLGKTATPDYALGPHVAPLGLAFYAATTFPQTYRNGAFVALHGSSGRSSLVGYKVVYVSFQNGRPSGDPQDFLTGFIADLPKKEVYGRPVGLAVAQDGSLLVADDVGNKVWQVTYPGAQGGSR